MKKSRFASLLLALFFFFLFSRPVQAYIDPATTSYLIQILSALVISLAVSLGLFFSRIRAFFLNFRVRVASFWVRLTRPSKDRESSKPPVPEEESRSYPRRLVLAGLLTLTLALTSCFFGILDLFISNPGEFPFPFTALLPDLLLWALGGGLLIALLLACLRGSLFDRALSLLLGLLLASYLQAAFMNGRLPHLTGDPVAWENFSGAMVLNSLVWLFLLFLPWLIRRLNKRTWSFLVRGVPGLLLALQLIFGLTGLIQNPDPVRPASSTYLTSEGLFEPACEDNILVFILDRLDNRYIDRILAESPDFFDPLDGFTRFTNNSSPYSQTFPAVTEMLTGEIHLFDEGSEAYMKRAWQESPFLPGLVDRGYACRLYLTSSQSYRNAGDLEGLARNLTPGRIQLDRKAAGAFIRLSFYRQAPLAFKPFLWSPLDSFDSFLTSQETPPPYRVDDLAFYRQLKDRGLTPGEDARLFSFIHLQGSHAPYNMNELGEEAEEGQSSALIQTRGSFHILYDYLDRLKDLDLYRDATIIITGDHGARSTDTKPPDAAMGTGLFVKPAGREGIPLESNPAPVTTDHFRATVYQAAGLDPSPYGPSYFEVSPHDFVVRLVYHRLYASEEGPARLLTYQILGDVNNFDHWILLEEKEIP